jgi:hypothetical protein
MRVPLGQAVQLGKGKVHDWREANKERWRLFERPRPIRFAGMLS